MDKEVLVILKLKKIIFTAVKINFLVEVDSGNILVSIRIFSSEENYKYFIGYLYDD